MVVMSKDGRIQHVNEQTLSLFGYARNELVGHPVEVLLPERFREAHLGHRTGYFRDPHRRPMGMGLELFGRCKNGTEFPAEISLAPTPSWEGVFVIAAVRDITERKKTKESIRAKDEHLRQLRKVQVASPHAWRPFVVAIALTAVAAALRLWPLHSLGARAPWLTFYPAVVIASFYGGFLAGLLATVLSCLAVFFVLPAVVDQPFMRDAADYLGMGFFVATCTMLSIGSRAMHRARARAAQANAQFEASNHELEIEVLRRGEVEVEVRRLNEKLKHGAAELAATNRELESFSYSVAHDLRAPLRSIDGFSQALLEDYVEKLDADGKKYLSFIRESADHMAQLIDDLFALSRVTRSELRRERLDLSTLARAAIACLQRSQPDRRVDVVIQEGLWGEGDPRLLTVALDNLLGNAWKFTGKRDDARIQFGATSKDGASRVYFVRDNGAGFDMAFVNKLFGVFQRLHAATEFEGSGVGLATVQRVVSRHGGRVWAEGEVNRGATFYFTLNEAERVA